MPAYISAYLSITESINHEFICVSQTLCDMQIGIKREQLCFLKFQLQVDGYKVHEVEWAFWHAIFTAPEKRKALPFIRNWKATFV